MLTLLGFSHHPPFVLGTETTTLDWQLHFRVRFTIF
jgi:hypothetical protein